MNRLFGRAKQKESPVSLDDCIAGVSNLLIVQIRYIYIFLHYLIKFSLVYML